MFFIFTIGCGDSQDSQNNATTPSQNNTTNNSPTQKKDYLDVYVLDENQVKVGEFSHSSGPDILELGKDYYLLLHRGPGACSITYDFSYVEYNDQEVFVKEAPEKYDINAIYLMRGLKEGYCEVIAKVITNKITNETIECKVRINFVAPAS